MSHYRIKNPVVPIQGLMKEGIQEKEMKQDQNKGMGQKTWQ